MRKQKEILGDCLSQLQKRKDMHYPLSASKYEFLHGKTRFVDCSDLKVVSGSRFVQLFSEDKAKGKILPDDLELIKQAVESYEDASPKLLKRFGLIEKDGTCIIS